MPLSTCTACTRLASECCLLVVDECGRDRSGGSEAKGGIVKLESLVGVAAELPVFRWQASSGLDDPTQSELHQLGQVLPAAEKFAARIEMPTPTSCWSPLWHSKATPNGT